MSELVEEFPQLRVLCHDNPDFCEWMHEFKVYKNWVHHWQQAYKQQKLDNDRLRQVNTAMMIKGGRIALKYEQEAQAVETHYILKLADAKKRIESLSKLIVTLQRDREHEREQYTQHTHLEQKSEQDPRSNELSFDRQ